MIWVLVPYRATATNGRAEHLQRFIAAFPAMFPNAMIFIMEQSDDSRKFNRGALLNAGFSQIYHSTKHDDTVIFHDVDLLPDAKLAKAYLRPLPKNKACHLAAVWKRYTGDQYLGGALSMRCEDFVRINGYPNKYWGWGGEDDELAARIRFHNISVHKCTKGSMTDMEDMDFTAKKKTLTKDVTCQNKWENRDAYKALRQRRMRVEGLVQVAYTVQKTEQISKGIIKITVHLQ